MGLAQLFWGDTLFALRLRPALRRHAEQMSPSLYKLARAARRHPRV
jgi:glyoxylase-like metal-dependent hydrolase (beta-lactamase superfamily II)